MRNRLARKEKSVEQSTVRKSAKGSAVMVARIIELALYRAHRSLAEDEKAERASRKQEHTRFHFWAGASGKRYVHSVYDLLECPPLPADNYVLVRRRSNGRAEALSIFWNTRISRSQASTPGCLRPLGCWFSLVVMHIV